MSAIFKLCLQLFVVCLLVEVSCSTESEKLTYYVQLVRGSNDAEPPETRSTAIGPKLAANLRSVFSWTNYWEIAREEVSLASGQKTRVRLANQREVEIDLTEKGKRIVVAYSGGNAVTRVTRPIGQSMTVVGGDRDKETAWFIIVRRDKPPKLDRGQAHR